MGLKIGAVSKMTGISPSGIRYLEEEGLISPSEGRRGSYRTYTMDDVAQLLEYLNYRKCGISGEDIRVLLKGSDLVSCKAIYEHQCDEMEDILRQNLRLLHFLQHRKHSLDLVEKKDEICEIVQRPAIIWTSLEDQENGYAGWPDDSGFEIPYADSVLQYKTNDLLNETVLEARCGLGMYETDILNHSFLGRSNIEYIEKRPAVHAVVCVENDFSISKEEAMGLKGKLEKVLADGKYQVSTDGQMISKRILSTKEDGNVCRYDHLWIDIEEIH